MRFEVRPLKGVGPIDFGMTRAQVKKQLGEPNSVEDDDILEEIREKRENIIIIYTKKRVAEVVFLKEGEVYYNGHHLFGEKIVDLLSDIEKPVDNGEGYLHFFGIGITLGGFGKKRIPEKKLVMVLSPERVAFWKL